MSLVWPTKFANTLNFYAKQIWCLRIYEECLKILILEKLGLKLVFLKNFASHSHAFYSYFSMLGGIYAKTGLFFQNCVFSRISINRGYFLINRNWFKIFRWASVCFDRANLRFRSIENRIRRFLKTDFQLSQTLFQKVFFFYFSLSIWLGQGSISFFCRFQSFFLQGFPFPRPVCSFYPSFCISLHVFMHKFMVFG